MHKVARTFAAMMAMALGPALAGAGPASSTGTPAAVPGEESTPAEEEAAARPASPEPGGPGGEAQAGSQPAPTARATTSDAEGGASGAGPAAGAASPAPDPTPRLKTAAEVRIGPQVTGPDGTPGFVHTVESGETLWAISEAYFGTPWVWPSVWRDNPEVRAPRRMPTGQKLWVSYKEMRPLGAEEADRLLAGAGVPAALDDLGAGGAPAPWEPHSEYVFEAVEATGVVTARGIDAAAEVLGTPRETDWVTAPHPVYLSLGEGEVSVGDQFTLVRVGDKAYEPGRHKFFGYYVEPLGWAEVTEVLPQSSVAELRASYAEVRPGDLAVPRAVPPARIERVAAAPGIEGRLVLFPANRPAVGTQDVVFLDQGASAGVRVGNVFEVFRRGGRAEVASLGEVRQLPDHVIGNVLVVRVTDDASVGLVIRAETEFLYGDRFRAVD